MKPRCCTCGNDSCFEIMWSGEFWEACCGCAGWTEEDEEEEEEEH